MSNDDKKEFSNVLFTILFLNPQQINKIKIIQNPFSPRGIRRVLFTYHVTCEKCHFSRVCVKSTSFCTRVKSSVFQVLVVRLDALFRQ